MPKKTTEERPEELRYLDQSLPIEQRKVEYKKVMHKMLNLLKEKDFDPETFDPMQDNPAYEVAKRPREKPSDRLPTLGMKPKKILEGQMVGMYESKQDLYLMIAHVNNTLLDRIEQLEAEVAALKNISPEKEDKKTK